jgi:hypothetical protein
VKLVGLAEPNSSRNSSIVLIRANAGPFSVQPMKAGIAVDTSATDGGRVEISSTNTPGVLYVGIAF